MATVGLLAENPQPDRAGGPRGPGGQPLPVHRLPQHRPGGAASGGRGCERVIPVAVRATSPAGCPSARGGRRCCAEHGDDAKLLAGGHSLLPMMKLRLAAPERADRHRRGSTSCRTSGVDGDELAIGAATTPPRRSRRRRRCGRRRRCWRGRRARSATRRCATAAPSAARSRTPTRPPTCPWPCSRGRDGRRARAAGRARDRRGRVLPGLVRDRAEPDEMIVEVRVPGGRGSRGAYEKFTRRANDWAIVAVAVVDGRVALVNMGPTPLRALGHRAGGRRRRGRRPRPPGWPTRTPTRPTTCTPTPPTAATWPGSSPSAPSSPPVSPPDPNRPPRLRRGWRPGRRGPGRSGRRRGRPRTGGRRACRPSPG